MPVPVKNADYVGEGTAYLTSNHRSQPNTKALLSVYLRRVQEIENVLWDVILLRQLATAAAVPGSVSDVLSQLGALVGQPRLGLNNALYGAIISLRIRANRSQGTAEDIVQLASLLKAISDYGGMPPPGSSFAPTGATNYVESYPASFIVEIRNLSSSLVGVSLLGKARPPGVYGLLHYSTWPTGNDFMWGSRYDVAVGEGQWGSRYDAAAGGYFVAGQELLP